MSQQKLRKNSIISTINLGINLLQHCTYNAVVNHRWHWINFYSSWTIYIILWCRPQHFTNIIRGHVIRHTLGAAQFFFFFFIIVLLSQLPRTVHLPFNVWDSMCIFHPGDSRICQRKSWTIRLDLSAEEQSNETTEEALILHWKLHCSLRPSVEHLILEVKRWHTVLCILTNASCLLTHGSEELSL